MRYEYAGQRRIRERNKKIYRVAHWPIWIWVFFLAPGPLTFDLFEHGPSARNLAWLLLVMIGTGVAGIFGQLPGVEPRPYILRFTEEKPNPLYRRICYTFAWSDIAAFALLNLAGLAIAAVTGVWMLKQIYVYAYFPLYLPWSWPWARAGSACRVCALRPKARARSAGTSMVPSGQ